MKDEPVQTPTQEQFNTAQPPIMASLAKPKKKQKIRIIVICMVAFLFFCWLVDFLDKPDTCESKSPNLVPGAVVMDKTVNASSAREALREILGELNRQYGGTVKIIGGMGDADDRQADAVFSLTKDGSPYCGLIRASVGQNNQCRVAIRMAPPAQMANALAQGNTRQGQPHTTSTAAQPLSPHQLPDGSGSIQLPAGWNITEANQGAVVATGQNGDLVELGVYTQMYTQATVGGAPPTMVQWGPAKQIFPTATQSFWNLLASTGGPRREFRGLVESQPLDGHPNSQNLLAVYDWDMNGKIYRSLGLFIATPTSQTTWLYYLSSVSAPQGQFTQDLPTLMAIWGSRQVDPGVTQKRLQDAAAKLRSCSDIVSEVTANRQQAFDRANDNWTEYFRGQTFVRDANTGETREVPYEDLDKMVEQQNRQEGYNRFNVIPRRDLEP